MTRARSSARTRLVGLGYGVFYRIPQRWRVRLVRLVTGRYVIGAVVLVFDADSGPGPVPLPLIAPAPTGPAVPTDPRDRVAASGGRGGPLDGGLRLLLLRQPPGRGWTVPAGLLARGETPAQGAVREAAEETGLRLDPAQLVPAVPNAMVHTHGRWVDMVFATALPAATTSITVDGAEVWEARWHRLDALPPLTVATARLLGHYGIGPAAPARATDGPTGPGGGSDGAGDAPPSAANSGTTSPGGAGAA